MRIKNFYLKLFPFNSKYNFVFHQKLFFYNLLLFHNGNMLVFFETKAFFYKLTYNLIRINNFQLSFKHEFYQII